MLFSSLALRVSESPGLKSQHIEQRLSDRLGISGDGHHQHSADQYGRTDEARAAWIAGDLDFPEAQVGSKSGLQRPVL